MRMKHIKTDVRVWIQMHFVIWFIVAQIMHQKFDPKTLKQNWMHPVRLDRI